MLALFGLTFAGLVAPLSISKEKYRLSDLFSQHQYLSHPRFKFWPDPASQGALTLD